MIHRVRAEFNYEKAKEFHKKVSDGSIQSQKPDGPEIIYAMNRATIDDKGYISWTEMCFCPTPLMHERTTVFDFYFSDLRTKIIEEHKHFVGQSFMEKLSVLSTGPAK